MSEFFTEVVWRAELPDTRNEQFTTKALEDMAAQMIMSWYVPFNFNFLKVVGRVQAAWVKDNYLCVRASFSDPDVIDLLRDGKAAMRPGFGVENSFVNTGGVTVIDGVSMAYVSVVVNPVPLPGNQE